MGRQNKICLLLGTLIIFMLSACSEKTVVPSQQTDLIQEKELTQQVDHTQSVTPGPDTSILQSPLSKNFKGVYLCDNGWSLTIEPEENGSNIFVFEGKTDKETFGFYHEFWTGYDEETMSLISG